MSDNPVTLFSELGLAAPVLQAVEEAGYEAPSPIQAETIPPLLEGRDLLGQAQTGTGKTAAFALPLLSRIDLAQRRPQALVLTPTRELAIQVAEAIQAYARHLPGFHILPVYGGQGMGTQLRGLSRGVHLVVGTPGRVMDHLRRGTLVLDDLRTFVLDEADEMLRMGFIDDVEWILARAPQERQIALFSATMPKPIQQVARRHLHDPVEVKIASKTTTVETITQRYWQVSGVHKLDALTRILEVEPFDGMLIFVRTKTETVNLAEKLEARGFAAAALNGDMNQVQREQTVEKLKRGALDIVVGTDVVARGLDVERVSHVVNYDIPYDTEAYVHRIGRTGRAGRKGEAILFVAPRERRMLKTIERATRQPIAPMNLPSREAVTDKRVDRFKQLITETLESQELNFFEDLVDGYQEEHDVGLSEVAAALAYLVQRERPLEVKEQKAPVERESREAKRGGQKRPRFDREPDAGMQSYRIEVGREHGVQPKHVVGAIANEAGIDSRNIGRIQLYDTYSTVDLPEGLPIELQNHLKKVWVCGRRLNLTPTSEKGRKPKPRQGKTRP
ncbi:DEAD/DEAH box helicase [Thiohalomonas denitrificans]|uniref:ATP-dependent RNA helicase DeaD n=1 Tax=Thiohalomonas denitrificans TaxID=415747 RepID=A0A1G5PWQ2_9GAMM|nr:DEAD/DEAH box helicase [Thiohalomonas denitrificans]SCZ53479.1 ATP-dependent RNA helicase DeaD [Thiohalomonas denitrificans]